MYQLFLILGFIMTVFGIVALCLPYEVEDYEIEEFNEKITKNYIDEERAYWEHAIYVAITMIGISILICLYIIRG